MNIFKRNSLIFILLIGMALIVSSPRAIAQSFFTTGNPLDTPTGTTYTAYGTQETLDYKDALLNQKPTTYPADDITYLVTSEYGFSMLQAIVDQSVTPGEVVTHETYSVTNEGNADDDYTVKSMFFESNFASNWTVVLVSWESDVNIATLTEGTLNTYTRTVADNDDLDVYYRVEVPSGVGDAPDGATIDVYTTFETSSTPVGQYTGGNALTYSGTSEADDLFTDTVQAPLITAARTSIIDSPAVYRSNGGAATDPVPGAIATYTLTYNNIGAAAAEDVIIIARVTTKEGVDIPGTNLAHINANGDHGNVNITAAQSTANSGNWTVYYSKLVSLSSSDDDYGDYTNWTTLGAITDANEYPGSGLYETGSDEYEARWVKWEKASVIATENLTLTWGVTIR